MKHLICICLCLSALCYFAACKKSKSTGPVPLAALTFPASSDVPYDTSGIEGIFSANILLDTSKAHREGNILFTTWFTHAVGQAFADSAVITANGRTLTNYGRYFTGATGLFTPGVDFRPDTSIAWTMDGEPGYSFAYANTDTFPTYLLTLPDTIAKGGKNTFFFNAGTISRADTFMMKLSVPVTSDSNTIITISATPASGSIVLNDALINSLSQKSIGVIVCLFNHRSLTVNGYNYLFIKEYSAGKNVWFK